MATEYFVKLWDNNIIQLGIWQTIYKIGRASCRERVFRAV